MSYGGSDSWLEDASEELGVNESDDVLRQIRDLLALQVSGSASGQPSAEWLSSTISNDLGLLGTSSEGDAGSSTSPYFAGDVLAKDGEPEMINFGSMAETVVIHNVTDTIEVFFRDPGNEYSAITIESGDSPFTFSGVYGAHTQMVWYRLPEGSSVEQSTFSVLAKFYPGSINPETGAGGN